MNVLRILGTRGVPAAHGGFETFAEYLALYLVERGWRVVVYCQEDGRGAVCSDVWNGVERVRIPVNCGGAKATILFDWRATVHAMRQGDLCLTLGYNTAAFCVLLRLARVPNLINMDGIEWARAKWGRVAKVWFWLNERAGCWLGNHLVADHPQIKAHLESRTSARKITMIPYGAEPVVGADCAPLARFGLVPGQFVTLVARAEPENSILEAVSGFSARPRGVSLVVLGNYSEGNVYHRAVKESASSEVVFLGAIYDKSVLNALRGHCLAYIHGHQVGGTNPSLVEALGAGNAVIAHDNRFNRWVAGEGARYFVGADGVDRVLSEILADPVALERMRMASRARFEEAFRWGDVLAQYEALLARFVPEGETQRLGDG